MSHPKNPPRRSGNPTVPTPPKSVGAVTHKTGLSSLWLTPADGADRHEAR